MPTRAPKKFTDASQTEIRQEWLDWYAAAQEDAIEEMQDHVAYTLREPPERRWPELYDKHVGDGAWVLVVSEPATELRDRFRIPTPSLWWARPEVSRPGSINMGSAAYPKTIPGYYRSIITTPAGDLWLWPEEYVVCSDPVPLITDPDCTIHPLGGRPTLDEELAEQLFYLQSRGWSYTDALLQLAGVDFSTWGWIEFPEYARAAFEGVGARPVFT